MPTFELLWGTIFVEFLFKNVPSVRLPVLICRSVKDKGASSEMKREEGGGGQAGVSLGRREGRKKFMEVRNCQENLALRSNIVARCGQSSIGNIKVTFCFICGNSSFLVFHLNCMCTFSTRRPFITKVTFLEITAIAT